MTCFRNLLVLVLICLFSHPAQACFMEWHEIDITNISRNSDVKSVLVDKKSVHVYENSLYYAVKYAKPNYKVYVAIIKSQNGKAGVITRYSIDETIYYDRLMQNCSYGNLNKTHPAYSHKSVPLKDIDKNSFIYETNKYAYNIADNDPKNWQTYVENVQNKIKSNWKPTKKSYTKIKFTINRDGQLSDIKVTFSGGALANNMAINAIKKSAPFEHFPEWSISDSKEIEMNFRATKN